MKVILIPRYLWINLLLILNLEEFSEVLLSVKDGSADNLKIIDINVKEMPTGELSAGAGVGTNGGTVGTKISENNWLGEGKTNKFFSRN